MGRCGCPMLAADFIMVGQSPEFDAIGFGTFRQGLRGQGAI